MGQRVHARLDHVGVARQVPAGIEQRVRVAPEVGTRGQVVTHGVGVDEVRGREPTEVVARVEQRVGSPQLGVASTAVVVPRVHPRGGDVRVGGEVVIRVEEPRLLDQLQADGRHPRRGRASAHPVHGPQCAGQHPVPTGTADLVDAGGESAGSGGSSTRPGAVDGGLSAGLLQQRVLAGPGALGRGEAILEDGHVGLGVPEAVEGLLGPSCLLLHLGVGLLHLGAGLLHLGAQHGHVGLRVRQLRRHPLHPILSPRHLGAQHLDVGLRIRQRPQRLHRLTTGHRQLRRHPLHPILSPRRLTTGVLHLAAQHLHGGQRIPQRPQRLHRLTTGHREVRCGELERCSPLIRGVADPAARHLAQHSARPGVHRNRQHRLQHICGAETGEPLPQGVESRFGQVGAELAVLDDPLEPVGEAVGIAGPGGDPRDAVRHVVAHAAGVAVDHRDPRAGRLQGDPAERLLPTRDRHEIDLAQRVVRVGPLAPELHDPVEAPLRHQVVQLGAELRLVGDPEDARANPDSALPQQCHGLDQLDQPLAPRDATQVADHRLLGHRRARRSHPDQVRRRDRQHGRPIAEQVPEHRGGVGHDRVGELDDRLAELTGRARQRHVVVQVQVLVDVPDVRHTQGLGCQGPAGQHGGVRQDHVGVDRGEVLARELDP